MPFCTSPKWGSTMRHKCKAWDKVAILLTVSLANWGEILLILSSLHVLYKCIPGQNRRSIVYYYLKICRQNLRPWIASSTKQAAPQLCLQLAIRWEAESHRSIGRLTIGTYRCSAIIKYAQPVPPGWPLPCTNEKSSLDSMLIIFQLLLALNRLLKSSLLTFEGPCHGASFWSLKAKSRSLPPGFTCRHLHFLLRTCLISDR